MNYRKQSSIRLRWLARRVRQLCRLLRAEFASKTGQIPSGIFAQELEPRVLYDASPLGAVGEPDIQEPLDLADTTFYEDLDSAAPDEWTTGPVDSALWIEATPPFRLNPVLDSLLPSGTVELLAIDLRVLATSSVVDNFAALDQGSEKLEVIVIDAESNGINLISERLKSLRNVSAVHLIALQDPRGTHLGQSELGPDSIPGLQQTFNLWKQSLESDAAVLLYGWWEPTSSATLQLTEQAQLLGDPDLEDSSLWASISQGAYPGDLNLDSKANSPEFDRESELNRLLGVTADLTAGWLDIRTNSSPSELWPRTAILPEEDFDAWFGAVSVSGNSMPSGRSLPAEIARVEHPAVNLQSIDVDLEATHSPKQDFNSFVVSATGELPTQPESIASETLHRRHTHELFVVDGSLDQLDSLLQTWRETAAPGVNRDILVIQPGENGLETITQHLAQAELRYDALHLFTHGRDGEIQLGNFWLGRSTLDQAASSLRFWQVGLNDEADLLVYGCRVAANDVSQDWLVNLAGLLEVDLQASTDLTGSTQLGGDWDLEFTVGQIETSRVVTAESGHTLNLLLATGTASADILIGSTATETHDGLAGNDVLVGGPNVVSDGQFLNGAVSGSFSTYMAGQTVGGWNVTQGSIDLWNTTEVISPTGGRAIDLDGAGPGAISQTLTTVVGNTYAVRFMMSANAAGAVTKALELSVGDSISFHSITTTSAHVISSTTACEWYQQTFTFVATSTSTTIQFRSLNTSGSSPALSDVVVADLTANSGNDTLNGGAGADTILGSGGNDSIDAGSENDWIRSSGGNDTIDGGTGTDVLVFGGSRSDYRVTVSGLTYTITDLRSGSPDGIETVTNVETFRFLDQDYTTTDVALNAPIIETFENGSLTGWTGGAIVSSNADFGSFLTSATALSNPDTTAPALGIQNVQDVYKTFNLSGNQTSVTISFTFNQIDSWDGELFRVWVNDVQVSGNGFWYTETSNHSDTTPDMAAGTSYGFAGWQEIQNTYVLTVNTTGTSLKLGFGSGVDQQWNNETWGVDNIVIREQNPSNATRYLSDMIPTVAWSGFYLKNDLGEGNGSLQNDGIVYAKGLLTHPSTDNVTSTVSYAIGGATSFRATLGIDESSWNPNPSNGVRYYVYLDGVQVYDSGIVTAATTPIDLNIDTTGKSTLTLGVNPLSSISHDHAAWFNARLENTSQSSSFTTTYSEGTTNADFYAGGLVGSWNGNGHANDGLSQNNGTLVNGTIYATGRSGQAFSLDGVDDYVQIGSSSTFQMTNAFSLDAWVNPTGNGSGYSIIFNKEGEYELARESTTGRLQWAIANSSNSWYWVDTGYVLPLNTWTHIGWTIENGTVRVFANGAEVHQGSISSSTIGDVVPSHNDLRIGGRQSHPSGQNFQGLIDEVGIYNRALTASQIAAIVAAGGADKGLSSPLDTSNDSYAGGTGNDSILLGAGNDYATGGDGNDLLTGGAGNDFFTGGWGNDTLTGGTGNDTIDSGAGNDSLFGDNGNLVYNGSFEFGGTGSGSTPTGWTKTGTASDGVHSDTNRSTDGSQFYAIGGWYSSQGGTISQTISTVAGTAYTVSFDLGNVLGGATIGSLQTTVTSGGSTVLSNQSVINNGQRLSFSYTFVATASSSTISFADTTTNITSDYDLDLDNVRVIEFFGGADTLIGGSGDDSLYGGGGNDLILGGPGADYIDGGPGTDTLSYIGSTAGVSVNLSNQLGHTGGDAAGDRITNIENLIGSAFADTLTGNSSDNVIDGGAGTDTVSYASATSGVTVNLATTISQNTVGAGSDTLTNFENILGSAFADTLTGNANDNVITGGAGNDIIIGGAGTDLAIFSGNWRDYTITTGSDGQGTFYQLVDNTAGRDGTDKIYNIENIQFADGTVSAASLENVAPSAISDTGIAVEAGGVSNGTAGSNATGNVLTNDTDANTLDTKTVTGVAVGTVGSASGNVGSNVTGTYGTINIAANGAYTYTIDNSNATVQALRNSGNTLTDTFTYTMRDSLALSSTTQITVTIQGANDAPSDITGTLSIAENASNGTSVGTVVGQDVDIGDTQTYSLVDNAGGRFAINSSTGQVTVADGSLLNFDAATSHNITVRVTDATGATFDKVMAVSVTNVNEAPTITAGYVHNLAANSEDSPSTGTLVSTILAGAGWSDPDAGALSGIAITSLTGTGTWQYSTDGISWTSISFVSSTNSLLLDANTLIRYQPTTLLGETVSLGFRAWDQSTGVASTNALPSKIDSSTNGGSSAFSSQAATISLSVFDVNDAPQFGFGNGLVLVPAPDTQNARGVVVQSDGKVVVVGGTINLANWASQDVAVYRFNADGSVDTSFGNNGSAIIDFAADQDFGYDVKLQADGKIVIAAQTKLPGVAMDYGIIRLNADGTLDTSFGGTGKVTTSIGTATDIALTLAIQADGKIVAAGYSSSGNLDWSAVRYNTDGSLDSSFGGTGKVVVPFGPGLDISWGIAIQPDGKILLGGSAAMTDTDAAIVRLNADGSLDTSFGGTGQLTSGIAGSDFASAVALQGDGKILLGGTANGDMVVTRYLSSGVLDTTFGAAGRAIVDFDGRSDNLAYSVHVLSSGKIILAGTSFSNGESQVAIARLNSDGTLDNSFGVGGKTLTPVGPTGSIGNGRLTVQSDERMVYVGQVTNGLNADIAVLRFNADGTLDPTFNVGLGGAVSYTENGGPLVLDGNVQIFDAELSAVGNFSGATLTLVRSGGANSQDLFSATGTLGALTQGGNLIVGGTTIGTVTTNSGGSLTLTFNSNATNTLVNSAMQQIAYANSSEAPPVSVQIDWTFSDGNSGAQGTGGALTATGNVVVNITAVNDAPTAVADSATAVESGGVSNGTAGSNPTGNVLTNDTDVDSGDTKTVSGVAAGVVGSASTNVGSNVTGTYGTINIAANGAYTYTVDNSNAAVQALRTTANTLTDTFTYTMRDTAGLTSTTQITVTIQGANDAPHDLAGALTIAENAANGSSAGTITRSDVDAGDGATYSLVDNAGGRFAINSSTGVVTVANSTLLNFEAATSHNITVRVTDTAGATFDKVMTVTLTDVDEFDVGAVSDTNPASNNVNENATVGTTVGITASASDADATNNTITYSLDDSAGGRFAVNSSTGVVTVAGAIDYETSTGHSITVRATSSDGSFSTQVFTIQVNDLNEGAIGPVSDANGAANFVLENSSNGTLVGLTGLATDPDGSATVSYSLEDSAGGRFAINSSTGVVTVAGGIDREAAGSYSITIRATSSDTSFSTQSFTITIGDVDEFDVGAVSDTNVASNNVNENAAVGTVVGITASASDADATTNTITYSLADNDGGRFAINSSTGVVTVAGAINREVDGATRSITVRATSADGSFTDQVSSIAINDVDEFDAGAVSDTNAASNNVNENVAVGTTVGITAAASDGDATTNAITYSLANNDGGRFAINSSTGVVTVAGAIDREADGATRSITVRATSADGSFTDQVFSIAINDVDEFDVGAVTDTNATSNNVNENATVGTVVGITAAASDVDATTNAITYTLTDNDGGRFAINSSTGVVTVAGAINPEVDGATRSITVRATSADGSFTDQVFSIAINDIDEFDVSVPTDTDAILNNVDENVAVGTLVGITANAFDLDATTNTITYSLISNPDGLFQINSSSGVVTTAAAINREVAGASRSITVQASSSDGSTASQTFAIAINDLDEFDVTVPTDSDATLNNVDENVAVGTLVGITANAFDLDATTNTITYSLTSNPDGLFQINSSTGVVTTAAAINREVAGASRSITVQASSSDSSIATQTFNIAINDLDEFDVTVPTDSDATLNNIDENVAVGTTVGITANAFDLDATTNTITYSLTSNPDGLFQINSSTGVVTTAAAINREVVGASRSITVQANSSDGSTASQTFNISINDLDEFDVTVPTDSDATLNNVDENLAIGTLVGITANAFDLDATTNTITYSLTSNPDGLFQINSSTGVVTTAAAINREVVGASRSITVQASSSDGSIASQIFAIAINDLDEFDVGAVTDTNAASNNVYENAAVGTTVGITALASDADATTNAITYSLDNTAGGRFAVNSSTGMVTVAGAIDYETSTSHSIILRATSADGSFSIQVFTIQVNDVNEGAVGSVTDSNATANFVLENSSNGTLVGLTGVATDPDGSDTVSYSLDDSAGGRFAINSSTGVVTVAGGIDREAAGSYSITIRATSSDTSFSTQSFTITIGDVDEFDVGAVTDTNVASNNVNENAAVGTVVGITASASDADATTNTISYSLADNDGGRFAINSSTGVVTVAGGINREVDGATRSITVRATSADGSFTDQVFSIAINDVDEFDVTVPTDTDAILNNVDENVAVGTLVGITANAFDLDATTNTITYSLTSNPDGLFQINSSTGVVTTAAAINREVVGASRSITVQATSSDGSTATQIFTIAINDLDEFDVTVPTDTDATLNNVDENVAVGTLVGITANAFDLDATTNTITYSLTSNPDGLFQINSSTGVVTTAAAINREVVGASRSITVQATSSDGSSATQTFNIQINDLDEFDVTVPTDTDATLNNVDENVAVGTTVGVTANAFDLDATTNTITYSLTSNPDGLFQINSSTGVVTTAAAINREVVGASRSITVQATSSDGSTATQIFTIAINDLDEFDVTVPTDTDATLNNVDENVAVGTTVGVTANAFDLDAATNTITYSLTSNPDGLFQINSSTGVVTTAAAINREVVGASRSITVQASSSDGSSATQTFNIAINDLDEFDVTIPTDTDATLNNVDENVAIGSTVGITANAFDLDATTNTITYSLTSNPDGLFQINSSTGVVTTAAAINREVVGASRSITVQASSSDGSSATQTFNIAINDLDEFDVTVPTDTDATLNNVDENVAVGTTVGITANAFDLDATTNTITYSLTSNPDGLFQINSSTGVVTTAAAINREVVGASRSITVQATSSDGSIATQTFNIAINDLDEFDVAVPTDGDATLNNVDENVAIGSTVGITADAFDLDATTNTITYSLDDNGGGRFAVNSSTGIVTVAGAIDYEISTSHSITVRATSADGSFSTQVFTIQVSDVNEGAVGPVTDANATANFVIENSADGTLIGLTGLATDPDGSDTVSYSLDDNAGGRFTINSSTGVVTVAGGIDREAAGSYNITIRATSSDTSFSTQSFTITISDVDEFDVTPVMDANPVANSLAENSANGSSVGITAVATDQDSTTNTISYSLDDNSGGRFAIDSSTGVVTVADSSLLNFEAATSHSITIRATSADGSFSTQSFAINLTDVDEFDVTTIVDDNPAPNSVDENSATGTVAGIIASARDFDATQNSITFSLLDNAGGRFAIDSLTGEVTVANGGLLNREAGGAHTIVVQALSADGSLSQANYTIQINDIDEFDAIPIIDLNPLANSVQENSAAGSTVGLTAWSSDSDATNNQITYHLTDDDGGRFAINASTGVVTTTRPLDREIDGPTRQLTIRATSADGSQTESAFIVSIEDVNESAVTTPIDQDANTNFVQENVSAGATVGVTAQAFDSDATSSTVTFSLSNNDGGRFAIDANTGTVTTTRELDRETDGPSREITIRATSSDGSFAEQTFTILLGDLDEADATIPADSNPTNNSVAENSMAGSTVGLTIQAFDSDATNNIITYSLIDDDGGRFAIDSATGTVTTTRALDREADGATREVTIRASSTDGSFAEQTFTIAIGDLDEFDATIPVDINPAANHVAENAANGTTVGLTLTSSDFDATQSHISFQLLDSAGGRFAVDDSTGIVTVAGLLDYETTTTHTLTVRALSQDGSYADQTFTIDVLPLNDGVPVLVSPASYSVGEHSLEVGTVSGTDSDHPAQGLVYSIGGGADAAQFTLDPVTGELRFIFLQNYELPADSDANGVYEIVIRVSDGELWSEQLVQVTVTNQNDQPVTLNDTWSFDEDTALEGTVATNDSDEDSDPLSFELLEGPANAANFRFNTDGTFHYLPAQDYYGTDNFRYRVSDGVGGTAEAVVTLQIQAVNDSPVSISNIFTVLQGATLETVTGVLFNDSDVENDPLVAILVAPPTRGVIKFHTDGSFIYEPQRGFIGEDSFVYVASDGLTSGTPTMVIVNVDVNAAPPPLSPPPALGGSGSSSSNDNVNSENKNSSSESPSSTGDSSGDLIGGGSLTGTGGVAAGGSNGVVSENTVQTNTNDAPDQVLDEQAELNSLEQVADAQQVEEQLLESAFQLRELVSAYLADSDEGEVVKANVKIGGKSIEVNFSRRQLWEQLAYLQQQLEENKRQQADSSIEEFGFDLGAATMAASLSYMIWFLRGSAMMATMVTQVPAWKMVDPLVILDSLDKSYAAKSQEADNLNSFFERTGNG